MFELEMIKINTLSYCKQLVHSKMRKNYITLKKRKKKKKKLF